MKEFQVKKFLLFSIILLVSTTSYSEGVTKNLLYTIDYTALSGYSSKALPSGVLQNIQVGTANANGYSFALVFNSNNSTNPQNAITYPIYLNI